MIRYLFLILVAVAGCRGAEPKPVLVVLEQNPWLSVIGSDGPTFALYADGTLLCLREKATNEDPFQKRTVPDANTKAGELLVFAPAKMNDRYELSAASDQTTTVIWTPLKKIEIYGGWRKMRELDPAYDSDPMLKKIAARERKMWESLPAQIRAALNRIDEERARPGERWFPAKVEVMFWPYEHAPDESIVWPKEWPGLAASDTRNHGDIFSVFLPAEKLPDLRRFLETRKQKGAVLIDGKKMTAAIRFPFPGEEAWMH